MLQLKDIVGLNIEASSICNGRCPFCSRNKKVRPYGSHILRHEDFLALPTVLFDHLEWISFGGNFGDLTTNPDMPAIARYIKSLNPEIALDGDTNGSVQDESWWGELGPYFKNGVMCFSLDGLADTHAIHRKGTDFNRILRHIKAFTKSGGVAVWKFILFQHNEHQIQEAQKMAKEAGCTRFFVISSREYDEECRRPELIDFDLKSDIFASYASKALEEKGQAICKPYSNQSIYLAADGTVHPCCLCHCMYITEHDPRFEFVVPLIEQHLAKINFKSTPLEEILQGPYFEAVLNKSKTNSYCILKCNKYKKKVRKELILHDTFF
ncbi:MAG: radical SAM protein [Desulfobacteraceae bacterium]|nr:MAG: radical SAM protein [Desulfobacteraceae bacterium]